MNRVWLQTPKSGVNSGGLGLIFEAPLLHFGFAEESCWPSVRNSVGIARRVSTAPTAKVTFAELLTTQIIRRSLKTTR